jgi:hypothetical protein
MTKVTPDDGASTVAYYDRRARDQIYTSICLLSLKEGSPHVFSSQKCSSCQALWWEDLHAAHPFWYGMFLLPEHTLPLGQCNLCDALEGSAPLKLRWWQRLIRLVCARRPGPIS